MPRELLPLDPDPVIEVYKRDVDMTLLLENLRLTPQERLEKLVAFQRFAQELRQAGAAQRVAERPAS